VQAAADKRVLLNEAVNDPVALDQASRRFWDRRRRGGASPSTPSSRHAAGRG
jgi:hypothetical protein